jgi:transcriptional regulator with XRE-family HTH domain
LPTRAQTHSDVDQVFDALDQARSPRRAPLSEIRRLRQQDIAEQMGITQPAVSQLERRRRVDEPTLRSYVEACGATLEVAARLPDGRLIPLAVEIGDL